MKHLKSFIIFVFSTIFAISVQGQAFNVNNFRVLTNDITAYITPIRDLNDEVCALLKVVASHDFAFSTPLGIVERKNEVGEIWLFLPKGTKQITIKHPKWGVLRDFRFGQKLESRMTYELVINEPIEYKHPASLHLKNIPEISFYKDDVKHPVKEWQMIPFKRPKESIHYLLLANMGISSENLSAGIRLSMMRRHGGYILFQTNFNKAPSTIGQCNENGEINHGENTPYYTGKTQDSEFIFIGGGIHKLWHNLCLYEGLGYGKRLVTWESVENTYYKNSDYSTQGLAAELGLLWRFNKLVISAGALTISGIHWEAVIGFGIHF